MTSFSTLSRECAVHALEQALSRCKEYTAKRNYALEVPTTTLLSPYIRRRVIEEEEVLRAVLKKATWTEIEKLVQEIVWRTYWKGWLENNPEIWSRYVTSLPKIFEDSSEQVRESIDAIARGISPITCMNDWSAELTSTGYLHNHKRMWFASIWIFTLKLPWELGAQFFMERLIDGDPASNTLSWRWVAGLQTKGKRYFATPENIAKFTHDKWILPPGSLFTGACEDAVEMKDRPSTSHTPYRVEPFNSGEEKTALLIHSEDLRPETLPLDLSKISAVVLYRDMTMPNHQATRLLKESIASALDDASLRIRSLLPEIPLFEASDGAALSDCIEAHKIKRIVIPSLFQGFLRDNLRDAFSVMSSKGVQIQEVQREYDREFHPLAQKGFFPFWEAAKKRVQKRYLVC